MTTALAILLFALALPTTIVNWFVLVEWYVSGKRASMLPIVGGVFGFLACVAHPSLHWAWGLLAFAIDPGCFSFLGIPNLLEGVWKAIRRLR